MFKKLHRQMTIFASLITSGILILLAASCLVISERGLTHNTYERFLNNGNSCVAYLENQTVLSHKWILEAKQEYKVEFRIRNNGKKLYFDKLDTESRNQDKKEEDLSSVGNMLTEAARISREEQGLDVDYMGSLSLSKTVYFETSDFYACTALIPKGSGALSLVLVYPLDGLKTQIFHQKSGLESWCCLQFWLWLHFPGFLQEKCFALWKRIKGNKPSLLLRHPMN